MIWNEDILQVCRQRVLKEEYEMKLNIRWRERRRNYMIWCLRTPTVQPHLSKSHTFIKPKFSHDIVLTP
jgi:hypothetical protein